MTPTPKSGISTYRSTGSDGYTAGTFGYTITRGRNMWTDGGYVSRAAARVAARKQSAEIRQLDGLSNDARYHHT